MDDEAYDERFPYTHSSQEVLDKLTRKVPSAKRNTFDVQTKHFVGTIPVRLKPVSWMTLEEASVMESAVFGSSSCF